MGRIEDRQNVLKVLFSSTFGVDNSEELDNDFKKKLFFGIKNNQNIIDDLIKQNIKNWSFERISRIAKCAMRIGIYEMIDGDVPVSIAVNESVQMAKVFGSEEEANYVQAVLTSISLSYEDYMKKNNLHLKKYDCI